MWECIALPLGRLLEFLEGVSNTLLNSCVPLLSPVARCAIAAVDLHTLRIWHRRRRVCLLDTGLLGPPFEPDHAVP